MNTNENNLRYRLISNPALKLEVFNGGKWSSTWADDKVMSLRPLLIGKSDFRPLWYALWLEVRRQVDERTNITFYLKDPIPLLDVWARACVAWAWFIVGEEFHPESHFRQGLSFFVSLCMKKRETRWENDVSNALVALDNMLHMPQNWAGPGRDMSARDYDVLINRLSLPVRAAYVLLDEPFCVGASSKDAVDLAGSAVRAVSEAHHASHNEAQNSIVVSLLNAVLYAKGFIDTFEPTPHVDWWWHFEVLKHYCPEWLRPANTRDMLERLRGEDNPIIRRCLIEMWRQNERPNWGMVWGFRDGPNSLGPGPEEEKPLWLYLRA